MPQHSNEQNWEPDTISQCGALEHAQNDYTTYAISLIFSSPVTHCNLSRIVKSKMIMIGNKCARASLLVALAELKLHLFGAKNENTAQFETQKYL
jgi:hypothetical protein